MNKIPHDKLLHFFYGFMIYAVSALILNNWWDLLPVIIIAIGKEAYDKLSKKGTPEIMDILFTIAPGLILNLINIIK